eukprot:6440788-Lingulodinium_polyedra.AAC.1
MKYDTIQPLQETNGSDEGTNPIAGPVQLQEAKGSDAVTNPVVEPVQLQEAKDSDEASITPMKKKA